MHKRIKFQKEDKDLAEDEKIEIFTTEIYENKKRYEDLLVKIENINKCFNLNKLKIYLDNFNKIENVCNAHSFKGKYNTSYKGFTDNLEVEKLVKKTIESITVRIMLLIDEYSWELSGLNKE